MKNKFFYNFLITVLLAALTALCMMPAALPWWFFAVPVFLAGVWLSLRNRRMPAFTTGFLAGFAVWCGGNIYFDVTGGGEIFGKMAGILSTAKPVIFIASGLIGGLLAGLAFYAGSKMFIPREDNLTL